MATKYDSVIQSQSGKEVTVNNFMLAASPATVYGQRNASVAFPIFAYYGGNVTLSSGAMSVISENSLSITASTTSYVVASKSSGTVSVSTSSTNWNNTTDYWRLHLIVAGSSSFTSITDYREIGKITGGGAGGTGTAITVKNEGSNLTAALSSIDFVGAGVTATTSGDDVTVTVTAGGREILSSDRTYYVRTDGSNSNTGLANTSGGAFLTVQKAVDTVYLSLDLGVYNVIVQVADGTYSGTVVCRGTLIGSGSLTIQGNSTTPTNVVFSTGSSDTVTVKNGAIVTLKDFKITNTATYGIYAELGGIINFSGIDFGSVTSQQIRASDGGTIIAAGNYTISGGASNHIQNIFGMVRIQSRTITISGTPAYGDAFVGTARCALTVINGNTFSGSATGARYSVVMNGVIFVNGESTTYLPGNAAHGTPTATGGQYA